MKWIAGLLITIMTWVVATSSVKAQTPQEEFHRARIIEIQKEGEVDRDGVKVPFQTVLVEFTDGPREKERIVINHGEMFSLGPGQRVKKDEVVVVAGVEGAQGKTYLIIDKYRLDILYPMVVGFFLLVIWLGRFQGVGSIIGMGLGLLTIVKFIVPQILAGKEPVLISIVGAVIIMTSTIYLAHGFSRRTSVALVSTLITLVVTGLLAAAAVQVLHLTGLGNDEAASLRFGQTAEINFRGLLLGGIIIGALGVLDDITTSLSASIFELKKANPRYGFSQLVESGMNIGREHIASLVNTLVLAYAGSALPVFLFLVLNPGNYPLWMMLNSEMLVEEMVRTLTGSTGLLLAVPLTTALAAWASQKMKLV